MKDLVKDIGINSDSLEFMNVGDLQKHRERLLFHPSDHNFNYLMNALFTPLDMTDYEDNFVGWNEVGGLLPIQGHNLLKPVTEEPWPANHATVGMEKVEKRPMLARGKMH